MPFSPARRSPHTPVVILAAAAFMVGGASAVTKPESHGFIADNNLAMEKMMAGMSIKPSGDVDRDFADMMIPHHQGAIDMAVAELRYGSNEQLRRIAQEIIVDQQQEIAVMRLAVDEPLPVSAPAPTQVAAPVMTDHVTMHAMQEKE